MTILKNGRNFCFTLNNPSGLLYPLDWADLKALVYQEEIGESGTHHFQGYVEFTKTKRLSALMALEGMEGAHWENRKGTVEQNLAYCTKADTRVGGPYTFGEFVSEPGKRNDIDAFMAAVKDGMSKDDSFFAHPSIHARYPRFVSSVYERYRVSGLPSLGFIPRDNWQAALHVKLSEAPDPRKILWFYDRTGNAGKSHFANQYEPAYVVTAGKHADIYFAYNFESVVFFDWPRDAQDRFPYSVAESFKNGYFLSTKYETRRVRFNVPHVVVFSNVMPELDKLSADRWEIKTI